MLCTVSGATRRRVGITGLVLALLLPAGRASDEPRLLLNAADFARINARARTEPWVAAVRDSLVRHAEDWPAAHLREFGLETWAPPREGGGWGGHYICPEDGARLVFEPGHNRCPRCGHDYHGWPYDYVIYTRRHEENALAVRDLGIAYRLTGDAAYADKARSILAAYAAIYPTMPIRSHKGWPEIGSRSGGRVTSQTLNESDWVARLAFGYDLIRETLGAEDRTQFERDLLRSASDVVARRVRSLGNWTVRHNAAHLAVGLVLRDPALIDLAVNAEYGFRDNLRRGITAEGPWHEGSWGYHFYTMEPLFLLREMTERAGIPVPEAASLKRMLDAPIACMLPDGTLPNFNDSGLTSLRAYARYFDIGHRIYREPRYLQFIRDADRGLAALAWGTAAAGTTERIELGSTLMREAGIAVLRATGSDHTVAVKFGAHGGGHGHPDKLNFVSFANGRHQAVDPGTQSYAYKTHKTWDKVTVSHNTIVVDETTQAEATGRVLEWHPEAQATAIRLESGPVYPQTRIERLLVHTADYLLDVVEVVFTDGASHRIDWVYHNQGRATSSLPLQPYTAFPVQHGYQHLVSSRAAATSDSWDAMFAQAQDGVRLHFLGERDTTVVLGEGLGQDLTVPVPFAMARRTGPTTRFIAVIEPYREKSRLRGVRRLRAEIVEISTEAGVDQVVLTPGHFHFTRLPPIPAP
jgi:hypothetical protein